MNSFSLCIVLSWGMWNQFWHSIVLLAIIIFLLFLLLRNVILKRWEEKCKKRRARKKVFYQRFPYNCVSSQQFLVVVFCNLATWTTFQTSCEVPKGWHQPDRSMSKRFIINIVLHNLFSFYFFFDKHPKIKLGKHSATFNVHNPMLHARREKADSQTRKLSFFFAFQLTSKRGREWSNKKPAGFSSPIFYFLPFLR